MDSAPVAQSRLMTTTAPRMSYVGGGDARIRVLHREYLADLNSSVAYNVLQYQINPGLATTFPWLSSVARNYQSYKFRKLFFEYKPRSSTAQAGSVLSVVDYDAAEAAPINKTDFMAYHDAVSSATWQENCFNADKADLDKFGIQRYIRQGNLAPNLDIKTYDVGNFNIATQGVTGAPDIGELYVTYDVELMTPQLTQSPPLSAAVASGGSVSSAAIFGSLPVISGQLPVTAAANTLTFNQVGQYLVEQSLAGTTLTGIYVTSGTAALTALDGLANAAATGSMWIAKVNVTNPGQTVILTPGAATVTASETRIGLYDYSLA